MALARTLVALLRPRARLLCSAAAGGEFSATLKDAARRKDADGALQLLSLQRQAGKSLDCAALSASISACEGRCDSAVQLLNEAENDGVKPDLVAITATIRACEAAGRFEEAMALQRRLGRMMREVRGEAVRIAQKEKARTKMRTSMIHKGQPLTPKLATALAAPISLRRHLLASHAAMEEIGVVPVTLSYSVLIHEYLALKNWKRAARLVKEMVAKEVKFSFAVVDRVIDAAIAAEQPAAAGELLRAINADTMLTLGDAAAASDAADDEALGEEWSRGRA